MNSSNCHLISVVEALKCEWKTGVFKENYLSERSCDTKTNQTKQVADYFINRQFDKSHEITCKWNNGGRKKEKRRNKSPLRRLGAKKQL